MVRLQYFLMLLTLLPFISCVKNEIEDPTDDNSRDYFPLQLGQYITYAVDSIVFDDETTGNKKDTVHFELKEEIADFQLYAGDTIFYIHRFRRDSASANWRLTDVWTTRIVGQEAWRTEENLTFRKLVFPLREGKRWLGTSYIPPFTTVLIGTENVRAYQDWEAEVKEYNIADQIGGFSFVHGDVMHVSQTETDEDDELIKRYVFEKYARGIGLVHRIDSILDSRCIALGNLEPCLGKPWVEHAGKGYIMSMMMIDHN